MLPGRERLEPLQVIWGEGDPAGSDILLQVHPPLRARNGHDILPLRQQPGQRQLPCRDVLLFGQAAHLGHELQIALEVLSLEAWIGASEIVRAGNLPREKPTPQRAIGHNPNSEPTRGG